METKILKIDENNIDKNLIKVAVDVILKGGVVAFPTETLYGLGANAKDINAIKNIFKAKGRPSDNPLIVHIADIEDIFSVVKNVPDVAKKLMDAFWPGPLTIIMEKKECIPYETTAGLDTVGIRYPSNKVAIEFIKTCGLAIAAPSENISGKPSPTRGEHVVSDLNGKVDCIIVSNDSEIVLESTVIDVTSKVPVILRPGAITKEQIYEVIGEVLVDKGLEEGETPKAPGMKYKHYAPNGQVIIVKGNLDKVIQKIKQEVENFIMEGKKVGILATEQTKSEYNFEGVDVIVLGDRENPQTLAKRLFGALREFDKNNIDIILAEAVVSDGIGFAVMNRMMKAAGFNIVEV